MVIRPGLVSITFRKLAPRRIVELARQAGLDGIEWGGDVHVPHGDLPRARDARSMTQDAGLAVAAYGSYYRVGHEEPAPFETVVETAVELAAPVIRVWAGKKGSREADREYRRNVVAESRRIARLAAAAGITVAYEFHPDTLTDTADSAADLLSAVTDENVRTYWQAPLDADDDCCLQALRTVLPRLSHVHVFYWQPLYERRPLNDGAARWRKFLPVVASTGRDHFAMLEFVRDDSPAAMLEDAAALRRWLGDIASGPR